MPKFRSKFFCIAFLQRVLLDRVIPSSRRSASTSRLTRRDFGESQRCQMFNEYLEAETEQEDAADDLRVLARANAHPPTEKHACER